MNRVGYIGVWMNEIYGSGPPAPPAEAILDAEGNYILDYNGDYILAAKTGLPGTSFIVDYSGLEIQDASGNSIFGD